MVSGAKYRNRRSSSCSPRVSVQPSFAACMAARWSTKRACWSAGSTTSPGGTRSSAQSVISIASRVSGRVRSNAIATIVWSISAGASSYSPASQTVSSQWVVFPVTRMIQSVSADSTLRKYLAAVDPQTLERGAGPGVCRTQPFPIGGAGDQLVQRPGHAGDVHVHDSAPRLAGSASLMTGCCRRRAGGSNQYRWVSLRRSRTWRRATSRCTRSGPRAPGPRSRAGWGHRQRRSRGRTPSG